jgi:hypothetical protein
MRMGNGAVPCAVFALLFFVATGWSPQAAAVQQVYQVDADHSSFGAANIDVGFIAVAHTNIGDQITRGSASVADVSFPASVRWCGTRCSR